MKNNDFISSRFLLSLLILVSVMTAVNISYAGNIIVRPGKFDHFAIQVPEKIRAGEGIMVKLQAYDAYENLITDFGETGKDFRIAVSGSAQVQPSVLRAVSFVGGGSSITITDKKAEAVTLSLFEAGGTVPVATKEVVISPNKLNNFFVQSPQSVAAGSSFDVKIIAKDAFDNVITDTDAEGKNIKITSSGTTNFKITSMAFVFKDGVGIATLMAEKAGEAVVEVIEAVTGSRGVGSGIKVTPAGLNYFKVSTPKEAIAGESFEVTINAFDAFDNIIDNYSSTGSGVNISSTGQSKLFPSFIGQAEFRNGQALAKVKYEKAEEISIIVIENTKTQQGKSAPVKINAASPDNFVVVTPDAATAGQRFKIKIEAYDKFNNIVKNYNLIGNDVYLNVTGTGVLSPRAVSASEFVDGIASVDVMYDKAESFSISAAMAPKKEEKKISVKEKKEEVRAPEPVKVLPKKEDVEQRQIKKEEESVPISKVEKAEPAKEKTKEKVSDIKKISIIEAKNKAMVIINMKFTEDVEYKDKTEVRNGKEWIVLSLKPAANRAKKSLWKFKSVFVGEIRAEEDKTEHGLINIKIENLYRQNKYDVNRIKNSFVISITAP